jgi:mannosyltransferase
MRRAALLLLAIAVLAGGYLRFSNLGRLEMSDDEGASWAAAAQPTIADVIAAQARLNPGKMAVHEIALHEWMGLFGDSIVAQRSLSALLGTISIVIVFWIGWELWMLRTDPDDDSAMMVAALGAVVFAVNLVTIKYTREARMYPVMLTAALLQAGFFIRATRRGGILNYAGAAVFAIVAISANFAAALVPASEGLWLLYLLARSGVRPQAAESLRAWSLIAALALAALVFFALSMSALRGAAGAVERGAIEWIKLPEPWAPVALFNKATGSFAFPVLLVAAAWGVIRGWRRARDAVAFSLLWMWGPPVLMVIVSYAMRPLFVERYAISSFAPFFILVGIGIWELNQPRFQVAAMTIVVAVSLGHIVVFNRKAHDAEWREAAVLGAANLRGGETMTAVPAYSISVVRYYLPQTDRARTIDFMRGSSDASIVLLRDHGVSPSVDSAIHQEYPVELAHLRGVIVLRK